MNSLRLQNVQWANSTGIKINVRMARPPGPVPEKHAIGLSRNGPRKNEKAPPIFQAAGNRALQSLHFAL